MKAFEKTEHPHLFENSEWGGLDAETTPYLDHRIFDNRNQFAEIFGTSCAAQLPRPWRESDSFRHVEMYWSKNNEIVLICSLHGIHHPPSRLKMREIFPLYSEDVRTYMRRFVSVRGLFASGHEFQRIKQEVLKCR